MKISLIKTALDQYGPTKCSLIDGNQKYSIEEK